MLEFVLLLFLVEVQRYYITKLNKDFGQDCLMQKATSLLIN